MITPEPCRGCGRIIIRKPVANLVVRLDSEPLDADGAMRSLVGGHNLWRVTHTSASGARPAELTALRTAEPGERPYIVQEHACVPKAVSASVTASPVGGGQTVRTPPPKAPAAPSRRSSGPLTGSSTRDSARSAATQASEPFRIDWSRVGVRCSTCGRLIDLDDTDRYVLIELGATLVDSWHVGDCPTG